MNVTLPERLEAGRAFEVEWRVNRVASLDQPVFIVVSVSDAIRVDVPALPQRLDSYSPKPVLPGFVVLPQTTPGPLGLRYGASTSRVLVPLHLAGCKHEGRASIRVFEAKATEIKVAVVAKRFWGESLVAELFGTTVNVAPGQPELLLQNLFESEAPSRVIVSNSCQYRMQVFEGRYRVFDVSTGARVLERAGYRPAFSPTSRFVVAAVADSGGHDFEVVDLVAREVVGRPFGHYVGFAEEDAFLIDGQYTNGILVVRPTLISTGMSLEPGGVGARGDGLDFVRHGRGTACPAWGGNNLTIDLDAGLIILGFEGFSELETFDTYEIATGHLVSLPRRQLVDAFVSKRYKRRFRLEEGWNARGMIQFTHTLHSFGDSSPYTSQDWYPTSLLLEKQIVEHQAFEAPGMEQPSRRARPGEAGVVRGDWRAGLAREATPRSGATIDDLAVAPFSFEFAVPEPQQTVAFSNSSVSGEGGKRWATGSKTEAEREAAESIDATIRARSAALESRLLRDWPMLQDWIVPDAHGDVEGMALGLGDHSDDIHLFRRISINSYLEGLWEWRLKGRSLGLMQLLGSVGSDGHGVGGLWLFEKRAEGRGEALLLEALMRDGFWLGEHGSTSQFNRLVVALFFERYLVMASKAARTLAVFDIRARQTALLIKDLPQADLLQSIAITTGEEYIVQTNSDGGLFVFDFATGRQLALGGSIDGEVVLYTQEGYYWSTYEGAHFVAVRFAGSTQTFSFQQFAAHLNRPEIVRAALAGGGAPSPHLVPPPSVLGVELVRPSGADSRAEVNVKARSYAGLAQLRLFLDGVPIGSERASGSEFSGNIALPPLGNARRLTALAVDVNGFVSEPMGVRLEPRGPASRDLHAVVVGIDNLPESELKLTFARSDAQRIGAALRANVGRYYRTVQVTQLLDDEAGPRAILAALEAAVTSAQRGDTIVFSFAGHGTSSNDRYLLMSGGFHSTNPAGTGLAWSRVAEVLTGAQARVIVLLDACHAGLAGSQGLATHEDAASELLQGMRAPMVIVAASKGRQYSLEASKWGGGVFSHALVEVVQSRREQFDLDGDGVISVSELYRGIRRIVEVETGGKQQPWLARHDMIGDFALF